MDSKASKGRKPIHDQRNFVAIDLGKGLTFAQSLTLAPWTGKEIPVSKLVKLLELANEPVPPQGCEDWPFQRASVIRWLFQQVFAGGKTKAQLQKRLDKAGRDDVDLDFQLRCIKSGIAGKDKTKGTHSWKMANEEGGVIRAYDLRQLVFASDKPEKSAAR